MDSTLATAVAAAGSGSLGQEAAEAELAFVLLYREISFQPVGEGEPTDPFKRSPELCAAHSRKVVLQRAAAMDGLASDLAGASATVAGLVAALTTERERYGAPVVNAALRAALTARSAVDGQLGLLLKLAEQAAAEGS